MTPVVRDAADVVAASLWPMVLRCAQINPDGVERAGFGTRPDAGNRLFDAIVDSPSGVVFTDDTWEATWQRIKTDDGANYRVGNAYRRRQVQVAVVGDTVEISIGEQLIRSHRAKHDRTREHGALAKPGGRPHRTNAA